MAYMTRVDALIKRMKSTNEGISISLCHDIEALDICARSLIKTYCKDANARSLVNNYFTLLAPIRARLEKANIGGSSPRAQPFALLITGPTGVGKSTTMNYLIRQIAGAVCTQTEVDQLIANPNSMFYFRNPGTDFWDGYHGQPFIVSDEMNQVHKDLLTACNDISEFIGMCNTVPYILHMADLDSKGAVYARPRAIFATTNEYSFNRNISNIINTPEAFRRRWTLSYILVPKKQFCIPATTHGDIRDRRLDESLINTGRALDKDVHEFWPGILVNLSSHTAILSITSNLFRCVSRSIMSV